MKTIEKNGNININHEKENGEQNLETLVQDRTKNTNKT